MIQLKFRSKENCITNSPRRADSRAYLVTWSSGGQLMGVVWTVDLAVDSNEKSISITASNGRRMKCSRTVELDQRHRLRSGQHKTRNQRRPRPLGLTSLDWRYSLGVWRFPTFRPRPTNLFGPISTAPVFMDNKFVSSVDLPLIWNTLPRDRDARCCVGLHYRHRPPLRRPTR